MSSTAAQHPPTEPDAAPPSSGEPPAARVEYAPSDGSAFEPLPREHLSRLERVSVSLLEWVNRSPRRKSRFHRVIGHNDSRFIRFITRNLWELHGLENTRIPAERGMILVSNHRSFFDMYISCTVLHFRSELAGRLFFPVRAKFFYDRVLGMLLNMGISGGSMWPPIFRDPSRRHLNPLGFKQLAAVLGPGAVVGIHPEGKRGKGPDPYTLLPCRPGLGRLVEVCHPDTVVLPYFIVGLSNSFLTEVRRNFRKPGTRGEPVRIWYGEAMTAGELQALGDAQVITDAVMDKVRGLGEKDRAAWEANPRQA